MENTIFILEVVLVELEGQMKMGFRRIVGVLEKYQKKSMIYMKLEMNIAIN